MNSIGKTRGRRFMKMSRIEKSFVNTVKKGESNAKRVEEVLEEVGAEGIHDALELGCSMGVVSAFLAEHYGMDVTGTDYDPAQIELAQKRHSESERLRFERADASKMSYPDASFDLVVSQNVFHHIPNWRDAVGEVARVLRPEGVFIWHDLCVRPSLRRLFLLLSPWMAVYTISEIDAEFVHNRFETHARESTSRGPFEHHFLVLRKENSRKEN